MMILISPTFGLQIFFYRLRNPKNYFKKMAFWLNGMHDDVLLDMIDYYHKKTNSIIKLTVDDLFSEYYFESQSCIPILELVKNVRGREFLKLLFDNNKNLATNFSFQSLVQKSWGEPTCLSRSILSYLCDDSTGIDILNIILRNNKDLINQLSYKDLIEVDVCGISNIYKLSTENKNSIDLLNYLFDRRPDLKLKLQLLGELDKYLAIISSTAAVRPVRYSLPIMPPLSSSPSAKHMSLVKPADGAGLYRKNSNKI